MRLRCVLLPEWVLKDMGVYEGRVQMPKAIENSSQEYERFGWELMDFLPVL